MKRKERKRRKEKGENREPLGMCGRERRDK